MKKNENISIDCLKKYMLSNGVILKDNIVLDDKEYKAAPMQMALRQIEAIKEFHDKASKYSEFSRQKLKSNTGKLIESYKMNLRKVNKEIIELQQQKDLNSFEIFFLQNADRMIKRGEKCFKIINNGRYLSLILRSMKNNEICLGNTDFDNLKKADILQVASLNHCGYDMVEIDGIYFLRKLKKRGINVDFDKLITDYCYTERLNRDSAEFMYSVLSYPYEFIKTSLRYKENKKDWDVSAYIRRLERAIRIDGESYV